MNSLRTIWNRAPHCAFTDLVRFKRRWYCAFREADDHVGSLGRVRVLASADGEKWTTAVLMSEGGVDLRDPKLSIAPGRRLMLLMGGSAYHEGTFIGRQPRAAFSINGSEWSAPRRICAEGDWLWRAAWQRGRSYGITYRLASRNRWTVHLLESGDGLEYHERAALDVPGKPNEATLRFRRDGRALALVRREAGDRQAWIGHSRPPYTSWSWHPAGLRMGGPNFIILPNGDAWAASRTYAHGEPRVTVGPLSTRGFTSVLELPSGGDCGYPGIAWHGGELWISYYSSHEGKTAVYLARTRLD